ncbi:MAG: transglycosylase SLT domain-containing protein [Alistipes sp.]|jgi:membrane-bound lytic murein transglycosylase D|nr:transglycosylase SLT domain-containing protein [Alistipes sp.]
MKKSTILTTLFAVASALPLAAAGRTTPIFPAPDSAPDSARAAESVARADSAELALAAENRWAPAPEALDSLLAVVGRESSVAAFDRFFDEFIRLDTTITLTSDTPDSVYQRRLRSILSPIGLPWNDIVKQYIVMYTTSRRTTVGNVLSRSQYYFPIFEAELAAAGLPLELRMLPVIESALVPTARSRVGATGLWQFMFPTARQYGLEVTTFLDQRFDPVAATRAACRYLAFLHRMYGDWSLALAAYNCGPGNVNRALRRAGADAKSYWDVYPFLPAETRGYVPSFIAVTYAYAYHKQHGIEIAQGALPLVVDTVSVNRLVHLDQVATTLDIPIETLRALNPQYIKDIVPALEKTYPIVLPQHHATNYIGRAEEIYGKDSIYLAEYINPDNIDATRAAITNSATVHRVQSGETLGHIAIKHGVTVSQIMRWNNLKNSNRLSIGQRLEINK